MLQTFSVAPSRYAAISDPSLRAEIDRQTADIVATSHIIRSISRFGSDSSILRFDVIPQSRGRASRFDAGVAWTVRAVRLEAPRHEVAGEDPGV